MDDPSWLWDVLGLLSIPALVALNGFFVASEFSLVAVRRTKVEEMVSQRVPRAKAVEAAVDNLDRTIAATQLGITLASIALGWVGEPIIATIVDPLFDELPHVGHTAVVHTVATSLDFLLITFMHVVFGELIPKSIGLQSAEKTALWIARPLTIFIKIARPLIMVMNGVSNAVLRLMGFRPASSEESVHSVEELRLLIEDTEEAGILDEDQAELVQNVFRLSSKTVARLHGAARQDRRAGTEHAAGEGAGGRPLRRPHAHAGVRGRSRQDRRHRQHEGSVLSLQLDGRHRSGRCASTRRHFSSPEESVANALRLFRKSRKPMALVRDDEGKIRGMITLEDVLEEIVGDIEDEHDRPMQKIRPRRRVPTKRAEIKRPV